MATVKLELATTKWKIDDKYNQLNSRVDYQEDYSHQNILGTVWEREEMMQENFFRWGRSAICANTHTGRES